MEKKNNDIWRNMFTAIPDETLPGDFQDRVMVKIKANEALRKKTNRLWEILGYSSGIAVMLITCVIAFYNMDISFKLPEIQPRAWTFPTFDFDFFTLPSFKFSFRIGSLALLLLIADLTIRRRIGRKGERTNG